MLPTIIKDKTEYTIDDVVARFPKKKNTITQEVVDLINEANQDSAFNGDEFMESLVSYNMIMHSSSYSVKEYVTAMKFAAYVISEDGNYTEAYRRARKTDKFVQERAGAITGSKEHRELTSAASRYAKSKLVQEILTQAQMPLYLMFQGERYKAVAVLANEMESAAYSKDRIAAADKLLTHVKAPDNVQVELSVGMNDEAKSIQEQLQEQLGQLASNQKKLLEAGVDIKEVQRLGISADIIEAEIVDNGK